MILALLFFTSSAFAAETPLFALISQHIHDGNLRSCLHQLAKKNQWQAPADVTKVVCHSNDIADLAGLDIFSNIETLSLHNNHIEVFDGAPFKRLNNLNLGRNKLQALSLNDLPRLSVLYVFNNKLKQLSLTTLPQLKKLKANSNGLLSFRYDGLPNLQKIYMFDNEMEHIDIYNLPQLSYMDVRQNPMSDALYEEMDKRVGVTILHDGNADDWH